MKDPTQPNAPGPAEARRELFLHLQTLERPAQLMDDLLEQVQHLLGVRGVALYALYQERLVLWGELGVLEGDQPDPTSSQQTSTQWTALRQKPPLEVRLKSGIHRLVAPIQTAGQAAGQVVGVLVIEQILPFEDEDRECITLLLELGGETWTRLWRAQRERILAEATTLSLMDRNVNKLCVSFAQLMQDAMDGETMLEVWGDLEGRSTYSRLFSQGLTRPAFSRRYRVKQHELRHSWGADSHRQGFPLALEDVTQALNSVNSLEQKQIQDNGLVSLLIVPVAGFATFYLGSVTPRLWMAPGVALCHSLAELLRSLLERNLSERLLERREAVLHALLIQPQGGGPTELGALGKPSYSLEGSGPVQPLERMLKLLAQTLRVEYATLLRPRGRQLELTVTYGPGLNPGSLWPGEGSLSERTLSEGYWHLSHLPRSHSKSPTSDPLLERDVSHYSAVALPAGDGRMLGVLSVGGLEPFVPLENDFFRAVLEVFAVRVAAELREGENRARLTAAASVQGVLRYCHSSSEVYQATVQAAQRGSNDTNVFLLLFNSETDTLELMAAIRSEIPQDEQDEGTTVRLKRGQGLAWRVLDSGRPFFTPDADRFSETIFLTSSRERVAYLGVPLTDVEGQVLGVLSISTDSSSSLSLADQHALEALAQAAGSAIARLQALETAQAEAQRFERLAALSIQLELMENPLQMARVALETLINLTPFEAGMLLLVHENTLVSHLKVGERPENHLEQFEGYGCPFSPQQVAALSFGERVVYQVEPELEPFVQNMKVRSIVLMPLYSHGELYGALCLSSFRRVVPQSKGVFTLCEAITYRVERSLERSQNLIELRRTREQALSALGLMLEGRDLESGGHTERVTDLVSQVGLKLNLSWDALEHLRWGALLHDVGKVSVPDRVLLKPGALTPDEWAVMQAHTTLGESLLGNLSFIPRAVLDVVRHHHEKWNGMGYPDRLKGEQIPLLARIFALADVFDALRSERPYKAAWSVPEALEEIQKESGQHFDPELVQVFVDVVLEAHPNKIPMNEESVLGS